MLKLVSKSSGIQLLEHSYPNIGSNDILLETIASCYSKGTEQSTAKNHQRSIIQKVIDNQSKIFDLISKKEFGTLFKKLNDQRTTTINLGYSASARVLAVGDRVRNFGKGDKVVALGPNANHAQYSVVPSGLCVKIGNKVNPVDASSAAVASIALNSVQLANPLIGSNVLVIGCGLIGQFIIQFLNISGCDITSIDLDDSKLKQSLIHGSNSSLTTEEFNQVKPSDKYDHVFIVIPKLEEELWKVIGGAAKNNANIIMVGAADLNCPRDIFYKKQLNFMSPHSYGPGRGLYDFEILAKDFPNVAKTWDFRSNVKIFIKLLCDKRISTSFIDIFRIDSSSESSLRKVLENKTGFSTIFDWRNSKRLSKEDSSIVKEKENEKEKEKVINLKNVAIYGFSNFARDAHLPAIKKNKELNFKGVFNRTPVEKTREVMLDRAKINSSDIGTVVVSTNHKSHSDILKELLDKEKFVIVDKPLCTNIEELNLITDLNKKLNPNFMCFMNRRYSEHTKILKDYILGSEGPFHLDCLFSVLPKQPNDIIYSEGGRLIGEMCHHVDLALYLLGEPNQVFYSDNQIESKISKNENANILMSFPDNSSAFIRYSTMGDSLGAKEKIMLSFDNRSIELRDFKMTDLISNNSRKTLLKKFDKGFDNTWQVISDLLKGGILNDKELKNMKELDILTSKILLRAR
jgi:predicted dehydrogenase